jgi:hypothetical protein
MSEQNPDNPNVCLDCDESVWSDSAASAGNGNGAQYRVPPAIAHDEQINAGSDQPGVGKGKVSRRRNK